MIERSDSTLRHGVNNIAATMEESPSFASEKEEAAYFRRLYRETKEELDEYKETSADYERELETELGMFCLDRAVFPCHSAVHACVSKQTLVNSSAWCAVR